MNLSDMENTHVYYLSLHKSFSVLKNQSLFYPISEMNLLIAIDIYQHWSYLRTNRSSITVVLGWLNQIFNCMIQYLVVYKQTYL